jgi:hypothetical protein
VTGKSGEALSFIPSGLARVPAGLSLSVRAATRRPPLSSRRFSVIETGFSQEILEDVTGRLTDNCIPCDEDGHAAKAVGAHPAAGERDLDADVS